MFKIRYDESGTLHLEGRFDASKAKEADAVLESIDRSFIADCSKLDYISSAGIGLFLKAYKRLSESGHSFKLVGVNQRIKNVFHIAGLDTVFDVE